MKKLFTLICMLVLTAGTAIAQQVYTEFVEATGTLTYYYDDQMSSRSGITEVYDKDYGLDISYKSDVLKAVIDPSMKDAPLTSTSYMFYFLNNMVRIEGLENLNTAIVTDMSRMFYGCSDLTSLDLSSFNTANVTNMDEMFSRSSQLTSLDLSSFNTANVTYMSGMFKECNLLTSLDLSSFNTENVTDMYAMFVHCSALTSLDLSSFNTANVTDMSFMFDDCKSLTSLDLSSFNTARVTNMSKMFYGCESLTSLDLSSFNTARVTNMSKMFYGCSSLTSLDLISFNTAKVTDMSEMFKYCNNLTTIFCDDDWSTSSVLASSYDMFYNCNALVGGKGTKFESYNITGKTYARPDGGTSKPGYFTKEEVYTEFDAATGTLTYYYDANRETRTGITELYTPEDHDAMRFVGYYDKVLKAVIDPSMKKAHLTSTRLMFSGGISSGAIILKNLASIEGLENLNTSNVTDMSYMFAQCQSLTSLDLSMFDTGNVTNMNYMFTGCNNLQMVDISSFDISKVTDMRYMFASCPQLKTICCFGDWSGTSALTNNMFYNCKALVGGRGTPFNSNFTDKRYARPDGGTSSPGYFTADTMTGISLTEEGRSQMEDGAIYNLAGQRLSKTQRGINIVGGKKIAVK